MPTRLLFVLFLLIVGVTARAQMAEVCSIGPSGPLSPTTWNLHCTMNLEAQRIQDISFVISPPKELRVCELPLAPRDPAPPSPPQPLDAPALAKLVPSSEYTLTPQSNTIFLVTRTPPPKGGSKSPPLVTLEELNKGLAEVLAQASPKPPVFSVEIALPHASALGSLPASLASLSSRFTFAAAGKDRVFVTSANGLAPTCGEWHSFLRDLRAFVWSFTPEPSEMRVTSIDASSTATALGATGSGGGKDASGVTIGAIPPDLLSFSTTTPGDDAAIAEKKRVIAVLDLPRPELSLSAWVMQNSSPEQDSVTQISQLVREQVAAYNQGLADTVGRGWQYLLQAMASSSYFYAPFHDYLTQRVILSAAAPHAATTLAEEARMVLSESESASAGGPDALFEQAPTGKGISWREYLGACDTQRYCLGYTTLFNPLQPRLTDLLLGLIAANESATQAQCAVDYAQGQARGGDFHCVPIPGTPLAAMGECSGKDSTSPCEIWRALGGAELPNNYRNLRQELSTDDLNCQIADYRDTLQLMLRQEQNAKPPVMSQNCFRRAATTVLAKGENVNQVGLIRSSIADFLFNYKMSQQFPHEFVAYDLKTSATAMNTALRPLVDAFLQDVTSYQAILKRQLGLRVDEINKAHKNPFTLDKPRFLNNAIVTVNTIANSEASSDSATESYLEQINAPSLSSLAGILSGTAPATGATTGTTPLSNIFANMSLGEAQIMAAGIQQLQTSHVHLGRELSVDVKPTALLGANSAELQVTLKADDEAGSGAYSSGNQTGDAEISRFSKGDTSTRVRVDSLKLFEVSSFSSQLTTAKKRFPLLPPAIELPYIGSLLSLPLPPSREFHSSIAIMSAVVIPTAADIAFNSRFIADRLLAVNESLGGVGNDDPGPCAWPSGPEVPLSSACKTRPLTSLHDLGGRPVREFNRMMIHCLATNGQTPEPNRLPADDPRAKQVCARLLFSNVLGDLN